MCSWAACSGSRTAGLHQPELDSLACSVAGPAPTRSAQEPARHPAHACRYAGGGLHPHDYVLTDRYHPHPHLRLRSSKKACWPNAVGRSASFAPHNGGVALAKQRHLSAVEASAPQEPCGRTKFRRRCLVALSIDVSVVVHRSSILPSRLPSCL
jgi:hypothetical protein